jgi:hypothetical protein
MHLITVHTPTHELQLVHSSRLKNTASGSSKTGVLYSILARDTDVLLYFLRVDP